VDSFSLIFLLFGDIHNRLWSDDFNIASYTDTTLLSASHSWKTVWIHLAKPGMTCFCWHDISAGHFYFTTVCPPQFSQTTEFHSTSVDSFPLLLISATAHSTYIFLSSTLFSFTCNSELFAIFYSYPLVEILPCNWTGNHFLRSVSFVLFFLLYNFVPLPFSFWTLNSC
jgi:hypothetical protein